MRVDYLVVGAGPAGAYFARRAADKGYRVLVVDMSPMPGFKVCGGAIPVEFERDVAKVPSSSIVAEVRSFRVYVDGEIVWELSGRRWGYFIDKSMFLKEVLEGVDVARGVYTGSSVKGVDVRAEKIVVAIGAFNQAYRGDRVYAVQAEYEGVFEEGTMNLYFDSRHIGYYWVFPVSQRRARIGVGGYASIQRLIEMLERFTRSLGARRVTDFKAAPINVGGVIEERLDEDRPVVGEAAGFVYPLTGEGIRPAAKSAILAFRVLEGDKSARSEWTRLVKSVNLQRKILEAISAAKPESRVRFMKMLDAETAMKLALGELEAVPRVIRYLPSRLLSLIARL